MEHEEFNLTLAELGADTLAAIDQGLADNAQEQARAMGWDQVAA